MVSTLISQPRKICINMNRDLNEIRKSETDLLKVMILCGILLKI